MKKEQALLTYIVQIFIVYLQLLITAPIVYSRIMLSCDVLYQFIKVLLSKYRERSEQISFIIHLALLKLFSSLTV